MKLNFAHQRILAVIAHPDDTELLCAGTLARAREDGAALGICVLCQGDKGQPEKPIRNLTAVRRAELRAAAKLLGAAVFTHDCHDGELVEDAVSRATLIESMRQFQATLVLAHAPEDYHPDHQAAAKLAEAATWFSASRGHRTKSPALPTQPALWWMDTLNMSGFAPGIYIDISRHAEVKEQMLACHRSQLSRWKEGDPTALPVVMRRQYQARGAQAGVAAAEAFRPYDAFKRARAW